MNLIAGTLALADVMTAMSDRRPVFHSEADFQFEFARTVADIAPDVRIRLEVPMRRDDRRTEYVDLVCETDEQRTLIEFKYVTRRWTGTDSLTGEQFRLRNHAAMDLARLHFIHDVRRLENWTERDDYTNGAAVLLTNDPSLWSAPRQATTNDAAFRIHQDRTLTGALTWGTPERAYPRNNRTLRGTYIANWHDYGTEPLPGTGGHLRWLAWTVNA